LQDILIGLLSRIVPLRGQMVKEGKETPEGKKVFFSFVLSLWDTADETAIDCSSLDS
jgi:hypothetical protein